MSDQNEMHRTLGAHDADIANLQRTVDKLAADVSAIRSAVDQGTGGWKAIMWLGGISGSLGGMIGWAISHFGGKGSLP